MIKITGSAFLESSREKVWPRIFDPHSLMALIPGCEDLEQLAPDEYRGKIHVGVASISGSYNVIVKIIEVSPPDRCSFVGEINGSTGTIKGDAAFTLQEVNTKSLIEYEVNALITGALAKVNPRFVEGIAKNLIKSGMARLNKQLEQESQVDRSRQASNSSNIANR
jgi:carbon monoxide dehydrogenase subunit G